MTSQARLDLSLSKTKSNVSGTPECEATSKHAPDFEMLRTTQEIPAAQPNMMVACFNIRCRSGVRSFMSGMLDANSYNSITDDDDDAEQNRHKNR